MLHSKTAITAVLLFALQYASARAQSSLLVNGSFEQGRFTGGSNTQLLPGSTNITGWTVVGAPNLDIGWINPANGYGLSGSDGGYFLDLSGVHDSKPYGGISQTFPTVVGQPYDVSFDVGSATRYDGSTPPAVSVSVDDLKVGVFTVGTVQANGWQRFRFSFTAVSSATTLAFYGANTNNLAYIGLDNVIATEVYLQPPGEFQPAIAGHGRAVAATVNPRSPAEALVASESGGLFRTPDYGAHWSHVDGLKMFRMVDVMYGPSHPNKGLTVVATGWSDSHVVSQGGLWASLDGGQTWSKPVYDSPIAREITYGIAFEPDTGNIYVGSDNGLVISRDNGANWKLFVQPSTNAWGPIYSLAAQRDGIVDICGPTGHRRSFNNGTTFSAVTNPRAVESVHGLAVSPVEPGVVFLASRVEPPTGCTNPAAALFEGDYQVNGTVVWSQVSPSLCRDGGRASWVATNPSRDGDLTHFDIYFGTGKDVIRQTVVRKGGGLPRCIPVLFPQDVNGWTPVIVDHSDQNGMAFSTDGGDCAEYMVTDGGVHGPLDAGDPKECGGQWGILHPNQNDGYNALQIYEVSGQLDLLPSVLHTDLYIGTQDNQLWASYDGGLSWPITQGNEGYHIQVPRYADSDQCCNAMAWFQPINGNLSSLALYEHPLAWRDPPPAGQTIDNPTLIHPNLMNLTTAGPGGNVFIQYGDDRGILGQPTKSLFVTADLGVTWSKVVEVPVDLRSWPEVSINGTEVTIYEAYKLDRPVPYVPDPVGILKITGLDIYGHITNPRISYADGTGFGSLGSFCLGEGTWVCPVVFAVDPNDPSHLLAPDVGFNQMKFSLDGGATWSSDAALTSLVTAVDPSTQQPSLRFSIPNDSYSFSRVPPGAPLQVHAISFDPYHKGTILVGTEAAGIFLSTDGGKSWAPIPDSEKVTGISSFFFIDEGRDNNNAFPEAIVSTYGRGLWKLTLPHPAGLVPFNLPSLLADWAACWLRSPEGGCDAAKDLLTPTLCTGCVHLAVVDGTINDLLLDQQGLVAGIAISGGRVVASTQDGQPVNSYLQVVISPAAGPFVGCPECTNVIAQAGAVRGLVLDSGGGLKAIIGGIGPLPDEEGIREFAAASGQVAPTAEVVPPGGPYLRVSGTVAMGGQPTAGLGDTVTVSGTGFCGDIACSGVRLTIGDRVVASNIVVNPGGSFQARVGITESRGAYTITAAQEATSGSLASSSPLMVVGFEFDDAASAPSLTVQASQVGLNISWAQSDQTFILKWTTDLGSPNSWHPYPESPTLAGGTNSVSIKPTDGSAFFRLQSP